MFPFLHIFFVGVWCGCIAVEFILERSPRVFPGMKEFVPALHDKIDRYVELPTVMMVLATGLIQIRWESLQGLYLLKVVAGLIAVLMNILCFIPVYRRKQFQEKRDRALVRRETKRILRYAQVGIVSGVLALYLGLRL